MDSEKSFPLLPLRDVVVFPHMMVPLFVGREKSIIALDEVMKNDKKNSDEKINFTLLDGIGSCSINNLFSEDEL